VNDERKASCRRWWKSFMRPGRSTATTCRLPRAGGLVSLDPGLLVTPPDGLAMGYVPIVTRQSHHHLGSGTERHFRRCLAG